MIKGEKSRGHTKKNCEGQNTKIQYKLRFIYQAIFIDLLPLPSREMDLFIQLQGDIQVGVYLYVTRRRSFSVATSCSLRDRCY